MSLGTRADFGSRRATAAASEKARRGGPFRASQPVGAPYSLTRSTRKATRTWARHSSRLSPRRPVETRSTALMFRSGLLRLVQRLLDRVVGALARRADQLDDLDCRHDSPPARGWRSSIYGSRRMSDRRSAIQRAPGGLVAPRRRRLRPTPSASAARSQGLPRSPSVRRRGAVSCRNCSSAAAIAAASCGAGARRDQLERGPAADGACRSTVML